MQEMMTAMEDICNFFRCIGYLHYRFFNNSNQHQCNPNSNHHRYQCKCKRDNRRNQRISFLLYRIGNTSSPSCQQIADIVVDVKSTTVGLIVEKIAEAVEIKDENILPPPSIGRVDKGHNKYVYGIGKVGESVTGITFPRRLIRPLI